MKKTWLKYTLYQNTQFNNLTDKSKDSKLEGTTSPPSRTSYKNLELPFVRINLSAESFLNQTIRLHNSLPNEIKDNIEAIPAKKIINTWVSDNVILKP